MKFLINGVWNDLDATVDMSVNEVKDKDEDQNKYSKRNVAEAFQF